MHGGCDAISLAVSLMTGHHHQLQLLLLQTIPIPRASKPSDDSARCHEQRR